MHEKLLNPFNNFKYYGKVHQDKLFDDLVLI